MSLLSIYQNRRSRLRSTVDEMREFVHAPDVPAMAKQITLDTIHTRIIEPEMKTLFLAPVPKFPFTYADDKICVSKMREYIEKLDGVLGREPVDDSAGHG